MPVTLRESQDIDELASVLYDMLPGSGNPRLSFPTVAQALGLAGYWIGGSKRPAIVALLTSTFERERHKFCPLIEGAVRLSVSWRAGKRAPLTRGEIEDINRVLLRLGYKIPGLHDPDFLASLNRRKRAAEGQVPKDPAQIDRLKSELIAISSLAPQPRGYAFERFLNELFEAYDLAPRGSFRLKGEQIDGSFQLDAQTYLVEAKWHNEPIGRAPLVVLNGTVNGMARWSRGLFVSYSGFTPDGIESFDSGRPTALIAMDGLDLFEVLNRNLSLPDVLTAKARRAAESNQCFVPVRLLFLS
jgi:Restriction endonuclease